MTINATLTVKRDDLLDRLAKRKGEIDAEFDAQLALIDDEIAYRAQNTTQLESLAAWHEDVAAGIREGRYTRDRQNRLRLPKKPDPRLTLHKHDEFAWWGDDGLEQAKAQTEEQRKGALKPLDTAIDLLSMSTGDTVEIASSDYQALLSGAVRVGQHWR